IGDQEQVLSHIEDIDDAASPELSGTAYQDRFSVFQGEEAFSLFLKIHFGAKGKEFGLFGFGLYYGKTLRFQIVDVDPVKRLEQDTGIEYQDIPELLIVQQPVLKGIGDRGVLQQPFLIPGPVSEFPVTSGIDSVANCLYRPDDRLLGQLVSFPPHPVEFQKARMVCHVDLFRNRLADGPVLIFPSVVEGSVILDWGQILAADGGTEEACQ